MKISGVAGLSNKSPTDREFGTPMRMLCTGSHGQKLTKVTTFCLHKKGEVFASVLLFTISYRPGAQNSNVDALSRQSWPESTQGDLWPPQEWWEYLDPHPPSPNRDEFVN